LAILTENLVFNLDDFAGSLLLTEGKYFQVGFYVRTFPILEFREDYFFQVFEPSGASEYLPAQIKMPTILVARKVKPLFGTESNFSHRHLSFPK
jgi:hypothetical protein